MPFYLRQVLGLSAVRTGQMLMLVPLSVSFIAPVSGWLSDKIGTRLPAAIGLTISTFGLISLSRLGVREPMWDVAWRLLLTGAGSGVFQSPNSSAIMGSVPRNMLGVASGMVAMMRNFGMVSGVALIGAVVSAQQSRYLESVGQVTGQVSRMAMVSGLHLGFIVAAGICALGIIASLARGNR
jgi:MFS family permease